MNHLCRITLPQWTPSCIKGRRIFDEIEIHKIRAYNTNSYHLQHPEANTYLQLSNKQHILFTWRTQIPSNTPYIPKIINQTPTPIHAWRQDLASSIHLPPSPRRNVCFLKLHNDRLFILWKYLTKVTQAHGTQCQYQLGNKQSILVRHPSPSPVLIMWVIIHTNPSADSFNLYPNEPIIRQNSLINFHSPKDCIPILNVDLNRSRLSICLSTLNPRFPALSWNCSWDWGTCRRWSMCVEFNFIYTHQGHGSTQCTTWMDWHRLHRRDVWMSLTHSAPRGARGTASSILVNLTGFGNAKWCINTIVK